MMIFISTALVLLATLVGIKFRPVEESGRAAKMQS